MQQLAQVNIGQQFRSPFGATLGVKDFVSIILSNAVALAGVIFFVIFLFGGVMIILGAGSGDKENIGKGHKAITTAIVGFLVVFTAYWLIVLIENIFNINILL